MCIRRMKYQDFHENCVCAIRKRKLLSLQWQRWSRFSLGRQRCFKARQSQARQGKAMIAYYFLAFACLMHFLVFAFLSFAFLSFRFPYAFINFCIFHVFLPVAFLSFCMHFFKQFSQLLHCLALHCLAFAFLSLCMALKGPRGGFSVPFDSDPPKGLSPCNMLYRIQYIALKNI